MYLCSIYMIIHNILKYVFDIYIFYNIIYILYVCECVCVYLCFESICPSFFLATCFFFLFLLCFPQWLLNSSSLLRSHYSQTNFSKQHRCHNFLFPQVEFLDHPEYFSFPGLPSLFIETLFLENFFKLQNLFYYSKSRPIALTRKNCCLSPLTLQCFENSN